MEIVISTISEYSDSFREFCERTFLNTYAHMNQADNITSYVETFFSEEAIKLDLLEQYNSHFGVYHQGELIAYIKLRNLPTVDSEKMLDPIEIERIYVDAAYKGQGIGKQLIEYCISFAKSKQFKTIWLGVWEHNSSAIAFYEKMGFEKSGEHIFMMGPEEQLDYIYQKYL